MKKKIETILDEGRYNGLPTHIVAEKLLDLFSVMPSLNIDIRPKAQKHLKGYYGSNDSRAFEEMHIDHYTQGYKQAEKDIVKMRNEA